MSRRSGRCSPWPMHSVLVLKGMTARSMSRLVARPGHPECRWLPAWGCGSVNFVQHRGSSRRRFRLPRASESATFAGRWARLSQSMPERTTAWGESRFDSMMAASSLSRPWRMAWSLWSSNENADPRQARRLWADGGRRAMRVRSRRRAVHVGSLSWRGACAAGIVITSLVAVGTGCRQDRGYQPNYDSTREGRQVVAVYIGGKWCGPCQETALKQAVERMKPLLAKQAESKGRPFSVIGVATDASVKDGLAYLAE